MTQDIGHLFQTLLDFCLLVVRALLAFRHKSLLLVLVTGVTCNGCPTSSGSTVTAGNS